MTDIKLLLALIGAVDDVLCIYTQRANRALGRFGRLPKTKELPSLGVVQEAQGIVKRESFAFILTMNLLQYSCARRLSSTSLQQQK